MAACSCLLGLGWARGSTKRHASNSPTRPLRAGVEEARYLPQKTQETQKRKLTVFFVSSVFFVVKVCAGFIRYKGCKKESEGKDGSDEDSKQYRVWAFGL
jgi:hypothetical protein